MSHIPLNRPWDLPPLDPADATKENNQTLVWLCVLCAVAVLAAVLVS